MSLTRTAPGNTDEIAHAVRDHRDGVTADQVAKQGRPSEDPLPLALNGVRTRFSSREARLPTRQSIDTRALFVFIGAVPNTAWLAGTIELDDHGFIPTGPACTRMAQWLGEKGGVGGR